MDLRKVWEQRAPQWRNWARTLGHDAYWAYAGSFFATIVPSDPGYVLEIGCGEGRVAQEAAAFDDFSTYLVTDAMALPFTDESFDTVVSYNSLMDLNDMKEGVLQAARVLKPAGRFCICIIR